MASKPSKFLGLVFAAAVLAAPASQAGVFRALLEKMDTAMNNYNNNMWVGDASVGKTVLKGLKGEGGGFFKTFDATAAALNKAQDQALVDVKAVIKAVGDIVFWLPKKLKAAFDKLVGGINKFRDKLGAMNQGGTVKERWKNLVGASGGGGGAQAMAFDSPEPEPASEPEPTPDAGGSEQGPIDGDALANLLGGEDASGAAASMSLDEIMDQYGTPEDAPAAPGGDEPDPENFGKLVDISYAIPSKDQQTEARKRIRVLYLVTLDEALAKNKLPEAAALIKSGSKLYRGNADGMKKAMESVASRHPTHGATIKRHATRMANLAKTAR